MLMQILVHTPTWVFVLLVVLVAFGAAQMADRHANWLRVSALPVAMAGLSLAGVVSTFGSQMWALLGWAMATGLAAAIVLRQPAPTGTTYDPLTRRFRLKGSVLPLVLMMGIFFTKYAVGVTLAMAPELAKAAALSLPTSGLYGVFSGLFLGRAMRLWRLGAQINGSSSARRAADWRHTRGPALRAVPPSARRRCG